MEALFENIYAISHDPTEISKIFYYGQYLHSISDCQFENCVVDWYLMKLHLIIKAGQQLRLNFIDVSAAHHTVFMIIDQIQEKLGNDVYKMKNEDVKRLIDSEFLKVICFVEEVVKRGDAVN